MTHTYNISGMTCAACIAKVKSELLKLPDVLSAEVQMAFPHATITTSKHIATEQLQAAISKAGKFRISDVAKSHTISAANTITEEQNSYFPIFLIFSYLIGITAISQYANNHFTPMHWMQQFMGGFFLVFSFFKFINIKSFAEAYRSYDIVALKWRNFGYIYPFIELGLGITLISSFYPLFTNSVAFIVMGISSIGVIKAVLKKFTVQCACLGTVIKLPLSKITLFEDILMVIMSGITVISLLNK